MDEHDIRVISIVDDDGSLRRSVRNLLTSVGFRVETFESADAFLQSNHRQNTGCMVLDLRMPGMDGLELLRHLAVTGGAIPAIILTAHGDDEARQRTLEAGAVAFLTKPFHAGVLLDAVKVAMARGE
jgi:FixJ family two-component response regulator